MFVNNGTSVEGRAVTNCVSTKGWEGGVRFVAFVLLFSEWKEEGRIRTECVCVCHLECLCVGYVCPKCANLSFVFC